MHSSHISDVESFHTYEITTYVFLSLPFKNDKYYGHFVLQFYGFY